MITDRTLHLLLVEDNPGDAVLLKEMLTAYAGHEFDVVIADRLHAALQLIASHAFDVVLLDLGLPDSIGLATLNAMLDRLSSLPIIVLTGLDDDETGIQAVTRGAEDYLVKDQINASMLVRTIRYAIERQRLKAERRVAEQFLRSTIDSLTAHVGILDADGIVIETNQAWQDFAAAHPLSPYHAANGEDFFATIDQIPSADAPHEMTQLSSQIHAVIAGNVDQVSHVFSLNHQSAERWFRAQVTRLRGTSNQVVIAYEDITEQRNAQRALQKSSQRLKLLHAIDQSILAENDADSLVKSVLEKIAAFIPNDVASIVEINVRTETATWRELRSGSDALFHAVERPYHLFQKLHHLQRSGVIVIENLKTSQSLYADSIKTIVVDDMQSFLIVPLFAEGHVLGALNIARRFESTFQPEQRTVAAEIAAQLAVALHQNQLHAAERQQRVFADALRDTVTELATMIAGQSSFDQILEHIYRVVPSDTSDIFTIKGDSCEMIAGRGYDDVTRSSFQQRRQLQDLAILERMARTQQPVIISDTRANDAWAAYTETRWIRSYMGVPITGHGTTIGFIQLNNRVPNTFRKYQLDLLQAFASHIALAIETVQMYQTLELYAEELSRLNRASQLLFSSLSDAKRVEELARQIPSMIVETFGKIDCGVILVNHERAALVRVARAGPYNVQVSRSISMDGTGLVPEAVRTRASVYVPNVDDDPRYYAGDARTQSEFVVPMLTGDHIWGVLDFQSPDFDAFPDRDRNILQAFANRVATAFENIRLYEQVQAYATNLAGMVDERTRELEQTRAQAEGILNSTADGIVLLDPEGIILRTNISFDQMFTNERDLVGANILEGILYTDHQRFTEVLGRATSQMDAERVQVKAWRADGEVFPVDVSVTRLHEPNSQTTYIICSFRDISQQKRTELALRNALKHERELNDLKTRFVSMASHEFRTPLATVLSASEIVSNYLERLSPQKVRERMAKIRDQVLYMTVMIDEVLELERSERQLQLSPEAFDIVEFCDQLVSEYQDVQVSQTHRLELTIEGNSRDVVMDTRALKHIVSNLISNAIKYSPDADAVFLKLVLEHEAISLHVIDHGIGIPPEDLQRLFEPFHRAVNVGTIRGSGLGLAIVYRYVEACGGHIEVVSEIGQGSTFTLHLPRIVTGEEIPSA